MVKSKRSHAASSKLSKSKAARTAKKVKEEAIKSINAQLVKLKKEHPKFAKYESQVQDAIGRTEEFIKEHPFLSVILSFWLGKKIGEWFK